MFELHLEALENRSLLSGTVLGESAPPPPPGDGHNTVVLVDDDSDDEMYSFGRDIEEPTYIMEEVPFDEEIPPPLMVAPTDPVEIKATQIEADAENSVGGVAILSAPTGGAWIGGGTTATDADAKGAARVKSSFIVSATSPSYLDLKL